MAQKVTVTIPDDLAKRLDAVKERFNVSRVCQEALTSEVFRQELASKENPTMKDVVERLKAEKEQYYRGCQDRGFEEGYQDAQTMSFPVLSRLGSDVYWAQGSHGGTTLTHLESLDPKTAPRGSHFYCGYNASTAEEKYPELTAHFTEGRDDPLFNRESYFKGWCRGVAKLWLEVKDQLEGEEHKAPRKAKTPE
jgi:hypothetical protein